MAPREPTRTSRRDAAFLKHKDHSLLWNMVEGAVVDALKSHPDYFTEKASRSAVRSITKRVVGALVGYAKETQASGRLGGCSGGEVPLTPAEPDQGLHTAPPVDRVETDHSAPALRAGA